MEKRVTISPNVAALLRAGTWRRAGVFVLPPGQLERPLYDAVNKVLVALGGKWDKREQGHVFSAEAVKQLESALAAGHVVDQKKTMEQFFTPADLAQRMAALADLQPDDHVLEPSGGGGALLEEALALGCFISVVEQDPALAEQLAAMMAGHHGCGVWVADFMKWNPTARAPITKVLMNPPFSGNQDIHHVLRAFQFLRPGGRLVAIMSRHFTFAQDRYSQEMRGLIGYPSTASGHPTGSETVADATVELLPAGTFKAAGTNIAAVLVTIDKAAS